MPISFNTQRFIPLINNSIKDLETQADDADTKGDTAKATALRDEADRVKKIVPVIGQKDRFNWQEIFKGNDKLEASVKSQIQTDLDTSQNDIEGISAKLEAKIEISPEEKQKVIEEIAELKAAGIAQMKKGKDITEPFGPYSRRVAEAQEAREKLKELPDTYDQSEFISIAQKTATEEKDWAKYKVVLEQMSRNGDWNEIILADKFNTDTKGKDDWAHFISEKFGKSYEDVQYFVHELGAISKALGQHRMDSPYIYKEVTPKSGVYGYQLKTPEEEETSYLYYSGIIDQEKRARGESRLGTFTEQAI
ncbi:hypothetical protein IID20_04080, partial [Patescibacteria group bacterium]|nr:hypothetical protein [Patescibacteria group bacterium]